jgi:sulfur-oxidizing protein SoxX
MSMRTGPILLLAAVAAAPAAAQSAGDPARGAALALSRDGGGCVLCHEIPGAAAHGTVGPSLAGVGARHSREALRSRVADPTRANPASAMPAYHRVEGLSQVARAYAGRPILDERELEDVVAFLATLR